MIAGTLTELSYMFCGKVPLPFPQMPWWPQLNPLSLEKTTRVLSVSPCSASVSSTLPMPVSIAVTEAK